MNCKPGDLAVVVGGFPERNIGRIVTTESINTWKSSLYGSPIWDVKEEAGVGFQDDCLRPLRDNPGQDETLTWRDVPTKEVV